MQRHAATFTNWCPPSPGHSLKECFSYEQPGCKADTHPVNHYQITWESDSYRLSEWVSRHNKTGEAFTINILIPLNLCVANLTYL